MGRAMVWTEYYQIAASIAYSAAELQTNGQLPVTTEPRQDPDIPIVGPVLGPQIPADTTMTDSMIDATAAIDRQEGAPQSPYSANRALIRDLTLPTIPSYDIPTSPPSSPVDATNTKFKHFLELKKQGVHFNEKLAKSSALKNPSLMSKLMDFADIDEAEQHQTTLSKALWHPDGFPEHAFKEELAKNQQRILKRKEEELARGQRVVDFIPSTTSGDSSRSGTPGTASKMSHMSAAERIMAGLDRGRSNSPQIPSQGIKRKTRFDG